jgi:hypothetical protein
MNPKENTFVRGTLMTYRILGKILLFSLLFTLAGCEVISGSLPGQVTYRRLPVSEYRKKMMAGWIGQMVGVSYGAPTEFRALGQTLPASAVPAIQPGLANWSFGQDDLYVEMTFLRTLEEYGLGVSSAQAGLDFARSEYPLWHANSAGRMNLRAGIAPPDSGHPAYNQHSDDIDFQIEADFAGLISPGLPKQAVTLGETFGSLMNYGDGLYAGQFIACMYSEAFFERQPEKLVEAGLACIPARSQYAEAVRDILGWWRENPQDWQATWQKIEAKYQDNPDYRLASCSDPNFDSRFNIDAKINGAYVVMGLLYGEGDLLNSMTIAMRGGQDSDCNPASAGGILFTTVGFDELPAEFTAKLDVNRVWDYTSYDFTHLVDLSEKLAREAVIRAGGRIETNGNGEEEFVIPLQKPKPGKFTQSARPGPLSHAVFSAAEIETLDVGSSRLAQQVGQLAPGWRVTSCTEDSLMGLKENINERERVLLTQSAPWMPCTIMTRASLSSKAESYLRLEVGSIDQNPWVLVVRADGEELLRKTISPQASAGAWQTVDVDLPAGGNGLLLLEVSNVAPGSKGAYGLFAEISVYQR